jgi:predicted small secreted protein
MKKSILRISIYVVIITIVFSSCTTRRVGCPVNAASGFGNGRIR